MGERGPADFPFRDALAWNLVLNFTRRQLLQLALAGPVALWARRARAFGESARIVFAQVKHGGQDEPRPHALRRLAFEIMERTSLEVAPLAPVLALDSPELFAHPFLYLAGEGEFPAFSDRESANLRRHLSSGGFLLADSADGGDGFDAALRRELTRAFPDSPLTRVPQSHVLYKSFYLLDHQGGRQIVAPFVEGLFLGGRLALVYTRNDLGGAWSRDDRGDWEFQVVGGDDQRETAFRFGVNLAMYATCLDYKDDQVHLPSS